jgi:hypothetical protein
MNSSFATFYEKVTNLAPSTLRFDPSPVDSDALLRRFNTESPDIIYPILEKMYSNLAGRALFNSLIRDPRLQSIAIDILVVRPDTSNKGINGVFLIKVDTPQTINLIQKNERQYKIAQDRYLPTLSNILGKAAPAAIACVYSCASIFDDKGKLSKCVILVPSADLETDTTEYHVTVNKDADAEPCEGLRQADECLYHELNHVIGNALNEDRSFFCTCASYILEVISRYKDPNIMCLIPDETRARIDSEIKQFMNQMDKFNEAHKSRMSFIRASLSMEDGPKYGLDQARVNWLFDRMFSNQQAVDSSEEEFACVTGIYVAVKPNGAMVLRHEPHSEALYQLFARKPLRMGTIFSKTNMPTTTFHSLQPYVVKYIAPRILRCTFQYFVSLHEDLGACDLPFPTLD